MFSWPTATPSISLGFVRLSSRTSRIDFQVYLVGSVTMDMYSNFRYLDENLVTTHVYDLANVLRSLVVSQTLVKLVQMHG